MLQIRRGIDNLGIIMSPPPPPPPPTKGEGDVGQTGFSVDPGLRTSLTWNVTTVSLEPVNEISPNLQGYTIGIRSRADTVLVNLTSLSRSLEF